MKIALIILAVLGVIIIVPLILALFMKKDFTIEREIVIDRQKSDVLNYVKFLRNQDHYNKWVMTDPAMKKDFRGTDGSVGFVYGWNGKEAGEGEQEIKNISDSTVEMELRFVRPMKSVATAYMVTQPVNGSQTNVKWGMKGTYNYPMNFMNLFSDKLLGGDMEKSLNNLKAILEKK